jgi:hypothetical protein
VKKRAMKKWIPKGIYCDGCKWWHHIKTIKLNRNNCEYTECQEVCWTKPKNSCKVDIVKLIKMKIHIYGTGVKNVKNMILINGIK